MQREPLDLRLVGMGPEEVADTTGMVQERRWKWSPV